MSSMLRPIAILILSLSPGFAIPAHGNEARHWDVANQRNLAQHDLAMHQAIERWKVLTASSRLSFGDYAGFLITYPGFPQQERLRGYAEGALEREAPSPSTVAAFFEKFPPLSNQAKARHAMALAALRMPGARAAAIEAWRGGTMSEAAEAALSFQYRDQFTREAHDARMNALLWAGDTRAAERQIAYVSPQMRDVFMKRLNLLQGSAPGSLGIATTNDMMRDPGYVYNRVLQARKSGNPGSAVNLLVSRPKASHPAEDAEKWVKELLTAARAGSSDSAVRIASSIDDGFAPGTDISQLSYRLRDDYTSLMWLGGTKALWNLRDPRRAAPLFYRYGAAAKTPGTRSKGFYWAGRAFAEAGLSQDAARYFEMAAEYPNQFYGMLALERLDRALPDLSTPPAAIPTAQQRTEFERRSLTQAVREAARDFDWRTTIQFFREISEQAETEAEHVLVADLARDIGRRDLAVILGQQAQVDGHDNFDVIAFPVISTPPGTNWTMIHAITRQESQFAQDAISHAGARGLMQLMPGTAREQAGKMNLSYQSASLLDNAQYNIRLGDGYFGRMMDYYGGAYPLAAGAYNAGPGNVNKWLAANGDPRKGQIDWIRWIEEIPIFETKNYVQRVLENAVMYEALNPQKGYDKGKYPLSRFLGKRTPG